MEAQNIFNLDSLQESVKRSLKSMDEEQSMSSILKNAKENVELIKNIEFLNKDVNTELESKLIIDELLFFSKINQMEWELLLNIHEKVVYHSRQPTKINNFDKDELKICLNFVLSVKGFLRGAFYDKPDIADVIEKSVDDEALYVVSEYINADSGIYYPAIISLFETKHQLIGLYFKLMNKTIPLINEKRIELMELNQENEED